MTKVTEPLTLKAEDEAGVNGSSSIVILSDEILLAQQEADAEADRQEEKKDDDELGPIPRMLDMDTKSLIHKTKELRANGDQLELLLLKAESYSHFIRMNQEENDRATREMEERRRKERGAETVSGNPSKKSKKSASSAAAPLEEAECVSMSSLIIEQPSNLVGGTLKAYQMDGLRWLVSLWENGLSGILGDEMGLGKTIQVISLIAHLRTTGTAGPFIIAGPLATLPNWINEFKKWLPTCPVVLYHGSKAERVRIRNDCMLTGDTKKLSFPVVITSFEICMIDRPALEAYEWQYIILDEGHRIKNRNCRLLKELKAIKSVSRLLLTGTPIQNSLEELWSLLNFVNPRIFDDLEVFKAWFGFRNIGRDTSVDDIVGGERKERIVSKLHEILRPFLLRRLKRDVLLTLPDKKEVVVYCSLTALQSEYYAHAKNRDLKELIVGLGIEGASRLSNENVLMQQRKVCNHPFLFGEPRGKDGEYVAVTHPQLLIKASGKFELLDRMLSRLHRDGHRVLIFSQMTRLLDLLQDYCAYRNYRNCRLDGSTKLVDRQAAIDVFNKDPSYFVFLLSTRAGGLGINLTGADTVILFDSDWNPHQDAQAQDRCHRIGQTKNVVAYRLLTAGTVDIAMMERQISKKKLERLAITGGDFSKAGQREGSSMSISRLKKLLEDDVKNISRRTTDGQSLLDAIDGADQSPSRISEEELEKIMNRDSLFDVLTNAGNGVVAEGDMYDIVTSVADHSAII